MAAAVKNFGALGEYDGGSGSSITFNIPSCVVDDKIVLFQGVDWSFPSGSGSPLPDVTTTGITWTARTIQYPDANSRGFNVAWTGVVTTAGTRSVTVASGSRDATANGNWYHLNDEWTFHAAATTNTQPSASSYPAPSVADCLVDDVLFAAWQSEYQLAQAFTPPGGMVDIQTTAGGDGWQTSARRTLTSSGASGTTTATRAGSAPWCACTIVMRPAAVGLVEQSGSDSGGGAESGSVAATITGADDGSGTESGDLTWLQAGEDLGTGTETGFVAENRDGDDTAAGAEDGTLSATVDSGDAATGTDAVELAATTTGADVGSGAETGLVAIPGSETGSGTDILTGLSATAASSDSGSGVEGGHVETLFADLVISLYGVHPQTGALVPLPDFTKLTLSPVRNSAGSISVDYPPTGVNFSLLRDTVTDDRDLEVEIWSSGMSDGALRGYLQEAAGDDVSEGGDWGFSGGFLELRMAKALVWPQPKGAIVPDDDDDPTNDEHANEKQELVFSAVTPGTIAATILAQAQARGALTDIARDFTTAADSGGTPWPSVLSTKYSPGATYEQVLGRLVDIGLAEWSVEWTGTERVLRLWVPEGRGTDLTVGDRPVVLRHGRNLIDAPRKWSVRDSGTAVLAIGGEGVYQTVADASALARRGRRIEVAVSANNLDDPTAVMAYAQAQLAVTTTGLHEVTHGIGFLPGEPRPILAYDVGDWVYSQTAASMDRLRIVQWTLTVDANSNPSGTVTLNDTVQDALQRLQRRLDALTAGETVVGTSQPPGTGPDVIPPSAPDVDTFVIDSFAYQETDLVGAPSYAAVTLGWAPVTTNAGGPATERAQAAAAILARMQSGLSIAEDWTWVGAPPIVGVHNDPLLAAFDASGSSDEEAWLAAYVAANSAAGSDADDVAGYRVRYRYPLINYVGDLGSGAYPDPPWFEPTPPAGVSGTSYTWAGVEAGVQIQVQVLAFDSSGNRSAWSDSITHVTAVDVTPPPAPSTPVLAVWFRTLDIAWDGLDADGAEMVAAAGDLDVVEVWLSQGASPTLPAERSTPTAFDATVTTPQHVANLAGPSTWNQPGIQHGVGWYAVLRAVDRAGNVSDPSAVAGPATAEQLVSQDLIDDIITATQLGPDSVESQHVVTAAITTAKILDANIVRAKIADLAVNSAKIEEIQAGLVTTGTLVATVTLSGIIRTASSGLRWEGDPSGIRFYNSSGALTIRLEGSTGNTLITGTMQSALTGERWAMMPDGTLRLYPPAGTNYSVFSNFGTEVVWRGPLNGSNRSGRVNVSAIGVGLNFSAESEIPSNLRGEIAVFENEAKIVATDIRIRADDRYGGNPTIMFATTVSGIPEVGGSQLQYLYDTSAAGGEGPRLRAPGINSALKFRPEVLLVQNASGSYRPINASAFNVSSSRLLKRDIRDLLDTVAGLRTKITRVKPRLYRRSDEVETRPERPPGKIPKVRLDAEGQPVLDETGRPVEDMVDGEWAYDPIPAPERIGFLAEELAAEFPQLVTGDLSDPESVTVDMMGVLAVLWRRVQDLDRPGLLG